MTVQWSVSQVQGMLSQAPLQAPQGRPRRLANSSSRDKGAASHHGGNCGCRGDAHRPRAAWTPSASRSARPALTELMPSAA